MTLGALYHGGNYYLPLTEEEDLPVDYQWDHSFIAALATVHHKGKAALNRSLRDMYVENESLNLERNKKT